MKIMAIVDLEEGQIDPEDPEAAAKREACPLPVSEVAKAKAIKEKAIKAKAIKAKAKKEKEKATNTTITTTNKMAKGNLSHVYQTGTGV